MWPFKHEHDWQFLGKVDGPEVVLQKGLTCWGGFRYRWCPKCREFCIENGWDVISGKVPHDVCEPFAWLSLRYHPVHGFGHPDAIEVRDIRREHTALEALRDIEGLLGEVQGEMEMLRERLARGGGDLADEETKLR